MMHSLTIVTLSLFFLVLSVMAAPLPSGISPRLTHHGVVTWFTPGQGNCGNYDTTNDPILAVSVQIYNNGQYCNRWIHITNTDNGQSTYAQVRDSCEDCDPNHLDLSPHSFQQLGSLNTGELNHIEWNFMAAGWSP